LKGLVYMVMVVGKVVVEEFIKVVKVIVIDFKGEDEFYIFLLWICFNVEYGEWIEVGI